MSRAHPLIAFDALGIDQPGGARTAVLNLCQALFRLRTDWRFLILLSRREPAFDALEHVRQVIVPVRKSLRARIVAQAVMPYLAYRHSADLVHFTKSQGAFVPGKPVVLTLFDATPLVHPEMHGRLAVWTWRYLQPMIAHHAAAVVTLSQNASDDLQRLLAVPRDHITIVPCAPQFTIERPDALASLPDVRRRYNLPGAYLLHVGILALKKNLGTLVRALAILRNSDIAFPPLVLAGPRYNLSDDSAVLELAQRLHVSEYVRYVGPVAGEDLPSLFAGAEIYLMSSLHEGFGITCLEAMQCGAPVIASRVSAIPEVVNDAALLVDDFLSPDAWAVAIAGLLKDSYARAELTTRGEVRARHFTWHSSAVTLADLYERILQHGSSG